MTAPPFVTWVTTIAMDGLIWSRLGPVVPVAPAAASVWHPAHPAPLKIAAPFVPRLANDVDEGYPFAPATEAT